MSEAKADVLDIVKAETEQTNTDADELVSSDF